jgi:hypothetical protein
LRAEREADRVDGFIGEYAFDGRFELCVRVRIVRRVGRAVTEEINGKNRAAGVTDEIDPPRRAPVVLERRAEPVYERDRWSYLRTL